MIKEKNPFLKKKNKDLYIYGTEIPKTTFVSFFFLSQ